MGTVRSSRRTLGFLWLMAQALSLGSGCSSEEPTSINNDPDSAWSEVQLPDNLPRGVLTAIAFQNERGLAAEITERNGAIILESNGQSWIETDPVPGLREATIMDITMDGAGRGALVGFLGDSRPQAVAFTEQPEWSMAFSNAPPWGAFLTLDVDEDGRFLTAGFEINRLQAWTGIGDENWSEVPIEAPGRPNDKALVDLDFGTGAWVACGFDDGAEGTLESPFSLLMIDEGAGWKLIHTPCGGCENVEYTAVAISGSGSIYLGGAVTDFSNGGSDEYVAFLQFYSRDIEEWTDVVLPDPGALNRVNDILLAGNGDIYLACGEGGAALVRLPAGGDSAAESNIEWRANDAFLLELGEASDGTVHAVGSSDVNGEGLPLMLQRR